jgi:solute carrier family 4 anion exchanger 3
MNKQSFSITRRKENRKLTKNELLSLMDKEELEDFENVEKFEKNQIDEDFDPFKRTGRMFGSLKSEVKHRYSKYLSDIQDGLTLHCFIAFVFIFTVCVAPALCFGGILADKTDQYFGVNEMLIATALNGVIFSLFSGQPIMIFGATGPFLVFEEMLYNVTPYIASFFKFNIKKF